MLIMKTISMPTIDRSFGSNNRKNPEKTDENKDRPADYILKARLPQDFYRNLDEEESVGGFK